MHGDVEGRDGEEHRHACLVTDPLEGLLVDRGTLLVSGEIGAVA
jgi:hypothetical protein